jgi:hypothetical protein
MSVTITQYLKDGKPVPADPFSADILKLFPNRDRHSSQKGLHRSLTTNIYKTKEGRFYHLHGNLNCGQWVNEYHNDFRGISKKDYQGHTMENAAMTSMSTFPRTPMARPDHVVHLLQYQLQRPSQQQVYGTVLATGTSGCEGKWHLSMLKARMLLWDMGDTLNTTQCIGQHVLRLMLGTLSTPEPEWKATRGSPSVAGAD